MSKPRFLVSIHEQDLALVKQVLTKFRAIEACWLSVVELVKFVKPSKFIDDEDEKLLYISKYPNAAVEPATAYL